MKSFTETYLILASVLVLNILIPPCALAASETEYALGLALYQKKSYAEATAHFEKYLAGNTPTARSVLYAALSNLQSNKGARAKQLFEYLVQNFPSSKEAELGATALANSFGVVGTQRAKSAGSHSNSEPEPGEMARLPDTAEIKFNSGESGHMEVNAYINGKLIKCWFDTGADEILSADHLREIGIEAPSGKPDSYSIGWAGTQVPIWYKEVTLKVGPLTRTLPIAVSKEASDLPPLIGQGFVKGYQYAIDNAAGRMLLTKKSSSSRASTSQNKLYDIPCIVEGDREYVTISVNGKTCKNVLIDTGAACTILSKEAANALGLDLSDAQVVAGQGVGGIVEFREVDVDIQLGPIKKMNFSVKVGGMGTSAIGQDFMSGWRFTVDREAKLLRFFH